LPSCPGKRELSVVVWGEAGEGERTASLLLPFHLGRKKKKGKGLNGDIPSSFIWLCGKGVGE